MRGGYEVYKVILHKPSGGTEIYETQFLHYAKRHADLYKDDYPFVEIVELSDTRESVIETFGSKE